MSYTDIEVSREGSVPIRLYQFSRGPLRFAYTGADRNVTLNNVEFGRSEISDSGITFSGEAVADPITITLPADSEIALMYRVLAPSDEVIVTIWDWHYEAADYIVSYVGTVLGAKWPNASTCEITAWSLTASLDKPGLTLVWQRGCPYSLYDKNCKVNKQDFKVTAQVQAFDGITLALVGITGIPDGWFAGGFIEWVDINGIAERRGVRQHIGTSLLLLGGTFGLAVGQSVNVFPGCVRTTAICTSKFNNLGNYGGAPAMPGTSPFDGNPVF